MDLELYEWGDGTIRLTYEDYMHGLDRHFVLCADGSCEEVTTNDGSETRTMVNLVMVLRSMLQEAAE